MASMNRDPPGQRPELGVRGVKDKLTYLVRIVKEDSFQSAPDDEVGGDFRQSGDHPGREGR